MHSLTNTFTHSPLCVLTSDMVCVCEQMNGAAIYSATILDLQKTMYQEFLLVSYSFFKESFKIGVYTFFKKVSSNFLPF